MAMCTFCGIHVQESKSNEIAETWVGISGFSWDKEDDEKKRRWACYKCMEIINVGMGEIHELCEKLQDKTRAKLLRRQLTNNILNTINRASGPLSGGQFKRKFIGFFLDFAKRKPE